jgi:hypothetical protein
MSTGFDDIITRPGAAAELPVQIVDELISSVVRESVVLQLGHEVPTTVRDSRIPVLTELPDAEWITTGGGDPDTGMKQTTSFAFTNEVLIAEELATIAVIPQNVVDDSKFDLWSACKPLLARAIARKFDDAVLWGNGAPSTFPPSLYAAATAAGMVVSADMTDSATDVAQTVLQAAALIANLGYNPNAVAVSNSWEFRAAAQRTPALTANPIGADQPFPMQLAGLGIRTKPLRWDASKMIDSIVAQWDLVLIGLRKDITLEMFNSGVLSDTTGKVTVNLIQQDAVACRCTFRAGYYLATPPTDTSGSNPCPVALVKNSGATPVAAAAEKSAKK